MACRAPCATASLHILGRSCLDGEQGNVSRGLDTSEVQICIWLTSRPGPASRGRCDASCPLDSGQLGPPGAWRTPKSLFALYATGKGATIHFWRSTNCEASPVWPCWRCGAPRKSSHSAQIGPCRHAVLDWRASLAPAAAVIPAPIAHIQVAATQQLVVEFLCWIWVSLCIFVENTAALDGVA